MNRHTAYRLFNLALFTILAIAILASAVLLATLATWANNQRYIQTHCTEKETGINAISPFHNDKVTVCDFGK